MLSPLPPQVPRFSGAKGPRVPTPTPGAYQKMPLSKLDAKRGKTRDDVDGKRTADELRERIEQAQQLVGPAGQGGGGPDYVVIRRRVPVKKGKWRTVSKDVEEADSDG
jgi:hypothetical protein